MEQRKLLKKQDVSEKNKIEDKAVSLELERFDHCIKQESGEEKSFSTSFLGEYVKELGIEKQPLQSKTSFSHSSEEDLGVIEKMLPEYTNESNIEKRDLLFGIRPNDSMSEIKTEKKSIIYDTFPDFTCEKSLEELNRIRSDDVVESKTKKIAKAKQIKKCTIKMENKKKEKVENDSTVKEKSSMKNSNMKKNFNKNDGEKKESIPIKNLVYKLKELLDFKVIYKELYGYEDGIYNIMKNEEDLGKFLMRVLPKFCEERIVRYTDFREIFQWLKVMPELQVENFEEEMERNAIYIPFQNGLYDTVTGELLKYSKERLIFYKLKATYLGKECELPPAWNNFLFGISPIEEDVATILCQMILNCLLIGNKSKTFALMLPAPNSGKSVLGNALIEIIGREHITTRSFAELSKRFGLANLERIALNICMEADTNLNKATIRCIKGLTGENYINSEAKGANHKVIYNNTKLVFGINDIPILEEMDEAFFNRLQCIPMMYSISVEQQDKFLLQKLITEADQFLSWLVNDEVTKQFVDNNFSYSYCGQAEELKQTIKERCENNHSLDIENDMLQEFIDLCIEQTRDKKDFISNQILYLAYQAFCEEKKISLLYQPKGFSRKFAKFAIGIKSKGYDPRVESKSPLNGFKGIKLMDAFVSIE